MSFVSCYEKSHFILMEGALGERLKREYNLPFDNIVALADIIYRSGGKEALYELWNQYIIVGVQVRMILIHIILISNEIFIIFLLK